MGRSRYSPVRIFSVPFILNFVLRGSQYQISYAPWPYHQLPLASSSSSIPSSPSYALAPWATINPTATPFSPVHITDHTPASRPTSTAISNYLGSPLPIASPLLHHAAVPLFIARKQVQVRTGQTLVNFPADRGAGDSRRWDADWFRLAECRDATTHRVRELYPVTTPKRWKHEAGSLTGEWDGWFSVRLPPRFLPSLRPEAKKKQGEKVFTDPHVFFLFPCLVHRS